MNIAYILFLLFFSGYALDSAEMVRKIDPIEGVDTDDCLTQGPDFPCQTIAYALSSTPQNIIIYLSVGLFQQNNMLLIKDAEYLFIVGQNQSSKIIGNNGILQTTFSIVDSYSVVLKEFQVSSYDHGIIDIQNSKSIDLGYISLNYITLFNSEETIISINSSEDIGIFVGEKPEFAIDDNNLDRPYYISITNCTNLYPS
ncbi:MAG: hypothetical protein EZS28_008392 [Streblomastix strix]|uniref:Right handed beta helix domain-containing protein n=1 Tax=Streblomastix strix TaxID=222440 RepID=A0A5J4WN96_9EUKA|nr:MAG: hypothetical protein EZS28_008392 [Streblomastix strix]